MQKGLFFTLMCAVGLSLLLNFPDGAYSQQLPDLAKVKQAAEKGDAQAQLKFGETFYSRFNFPAAAMWFRKAAEQGNAEAQWRLAEILSKGKPKMGESATEVPKAPDEAAKWVIMAANQGHTTAQLALGQGYEKGVDVKKDYVEAYKWYRLASKQQPITAKGYLDPLILNLTTGEIQEGEKRATAFAPHLATLKDFPEPHYVQDIKLRGISGSSDKRFAIINDRTFAKGEEASVKVGERGIKVKCLELSERSVLVAIEGVQEAKELSF
jgi:hypothetical protein